jgi:hypothetical protein
MILARRGLLQSHPSRSNWRLKAELHPAIAAALAAGPIGEGDLRAFLPPRRFDQGQSGTCFAHAKAACQYGAAAIAGTPLLFVPSPLLIASCTYADVRAAATPVGATLPGLTDTGAQLEDAAAADKWGVGAMGVQIAGRDGLSDVPDDPADNAFPQPNLAQLVPAAGKIMSGEYSVAVNDQAPKLLAACIDAKVLVWDGFFCDSAYENLKSGEVAGVPDQSDPNGGGHSELVSAYRTSTVNGSTVLEYYKTNSWGDSWCEGGGCWCSEEHVMAEWNLFPFAARVS